MDGKIASATQKLDEALKAATDAAVELQRLLPEHQSVPHYSVIEQAAHEVGVRLSCLIQRQHVSNIAAEAGPKAKCPRCQKLCDVDCRTRIVKSIDGEVEMIEAKARCSRCERDFFPSTHEVGV